MGPSSEDPSDVRSGDSNGGRAPDGRAPEVHEDDAPPRRRAVVESEVTRASEAVVADESGTYDARQRRDPESEMAAIMSEVTPDPGIERLAGTASAQGQVRRRAVGLDDELFDPLPERTVVRIRRPIEDGPPRESVPPRRVVAPPLPPALRRDRGRNEQRVPSLGWAVVAGVVIAGVIVFVQRVILPKPAAAPVVAKTAKEPASASTTPDKGHTPEPTNARTQTVTPPVEPTPPPQREPIEDIVPTPPSDLERPPAPEPAPKPVVAAPSTNPRKPPAGTPADIATTFAKLPVSPADLPPVGGVGRSGIHIDRIEMGSATERGVCSGTKDKFSLDKLERINVCLRVVHPREEETVAIVWQKKKDAGTARRGKIAIKPQHAYRTRAYLVLRKEYVGDWTVRIMSADGVELASHAFTIVP